jgi:Transglutaminase-like superfamily
MIRFCLVAAVGWMSAAQATTSDSREWFALAVNGVRTGYALEERTIDKNTVVEHALTTIVVRELGQRARIEYDATLRTDARGTPLSFDYRKEIGVDREQWRGVFENGGLVIRQRDGIQSKEVHLAIPDGAILSPLRRAQIAAAGDKTTLTVFDPQHKAFATIEVSRVDANRVRVQFAGNSLEQIGFDAQGRIERVESRFMGQPLTWTLCARECDARVAEPMDAIGSLVVRSPVHIPDWYRHRAIRYVVSRTDDRAADAVETFEQDVVRDGSRAVVTVCDDCGHESAATPADVARFLQPNAWVRSDDAQIRRIARGAVGGSNVRESMRSLTKFVAMAMRGTNDFLGYADAVTALRTGSGDCTEFAVLLAALARARDIPARIAVGLAYSDRFSGRKDVFSPHMWVQVWDGARWTSYDAALEGFDSTHIALAISDGDPASVSAQFAALPALRVEKAGVVRTP